METRVIQSNRYYKEYFRGGGVGTIKGIRHVPAPPPPVTSLSARFA